MLRAIVESEETIVRFQGSEYYYDFTIKSSDKAAISNVLQVYDYMNR